MRRPSGLLWAGVVMATGALSLPLTGVSAKAPLPVDSLSIVDATDFLERYRLLNSTENSQFYDLYSDRALIHAQVARPDSARSRRRAIPPASRRTCREARRPRLRPKAGRFADASRQLRRRRGRIARGARCGGAERNRSRARAVGAGACRTRSSPRLRGDGLHRSGDCRRAGFRRE